MLIGNVPLVENVLLIEEIFLAEWRAMQARQGGEGEGLAVVVVAHKELDHTIVGHGGMAGEIPFGDSFHLPLAHHLHVLEHFGFDSSGVFAFGVSAGDGGGIENALLIKCILHLLVWVECDPQAAQFFVFLHQLDVITAAEEGFYFFRRLTERQEEVVLPFGEGG